MNLFPNEQNNLNKPKFTSSEELLNVPGYAGTFSDVAELRQKTGQEAPLEGSISRGFKRQYEDTKTGFTATAAMLAPIEPLKQIRREQQYDEQYKRHLDSRAGPLDITSAEWWGHNFGRGLFQAGEMLAAGAAGRVVGAAMGLEKGSRALRIATQLPVNVEIWARSAGQKYEHLQDLGVDDDMAFLLANLSAAAESAIETSPFGAEDLLLRRMSGQQLPLDIARELLGTSIKKGAKAISRPATSFGKKMLVITVAEQTEEVWQEAVDQLSIYLGTGDTSAFRNDAYLEAVAATIPAVLPMSFMGATMGVTQSEMRYKAIKSMAEDDIQGVWDKAMKTTTDPFLNDPEGEQRKAYDAKVEELADFFATGSRVTADPDQQVGRTEASKIAKYIGNIAIHLAERSKTRTPFDFLESLNAAFTSQQMTTANVESLYGAALEATRGITDRQERGQKVAEHMMAGLISEGGHVAYLVRQVETEEKLFTAAQSTLSAFETEVNKYKEIKTRLANIKAEVQGRMVAEAERHPLDTSPMASKMQEKTGTSFKAAMETLLTAIESISADLMVQTETGFYIPRNALLTSQQLYNAVVVSMLNPELMSTELTIPGQQANIYGEAKQNFFVQVNPDGSVSLIKTKQTAAQTTDGTQWMEAQKERLHQTEAYANMIRQQAEIRGAMAAQMLARQEAALKEVEQENVEQAARAEEAVYMPALPQERRQEEADRARREGRETVGPEQTEKPSQADIATKQKEAPQRKRPAIRYSAEPAVVKGAYIPGGVNLSIFTRDANAITILHEMLHHLVDAEIDGTRIIPDSVFMLFREQYGIGPDREWTQDSSEAFVDDYMLWLEKGTAPRNMQDEFQTIRKKLLAAGQIIETELNPAMDAAFRGLLGDEVVAQYEVDWNDGAAIVARMGRAIAEMSPERLQDEIDEAGVRYQTVTDQFQMTEENGWKIGNRKQGKQSHLPAEVFTPKAGKMYRVLSDEAFMNVIESGKVTNPDGGEANWSMNAYPHFGLRKGHGYIIETDLLNMTGHGTKAQTYGVVKASVTMDKIDRIWELRDDGQKVTQTTSIWGAPMTGTSTRVGVREITDIQDHLAKKTELDAIRYQTATPDPRTMSKDEWIQGSGWIASEKNIQNVISKEVAEKIQNKLSKYDPLFKWMYEYGKSGGEYGKQLLETMPSHIKKLSEEAYKQGVSEFDSFFEAGKRGEAIPQYGVFLRFGEFPSGRSRRGDMDVDERGVSVWPLDGTQMFFSGSRPSWAQTMDILSRPAYWVGGYVIDSKGGSGEPLIVSPTILGKADVYVKGTQIKTRAQLEAEWEAAQAGGIRFETVKRFNELTAGLREKLGGGALYRSEAQEVDRPGEGAVFYTPDKSYADIYHGKGRVMRTASVPNDIVDVRNEQDRALVRKWIESKIETLQEAKDNGEVFGIASSLRDARKFLSAQDTPQNVGSAMANVGIAIAKSEGQTGIPVGLAEKRFLVDINRPAMTVPEHARSLGQEFSVAFRDVQDIPPATDSAAILADWLADPANAEKVAELTQMRADTLKAQGYTVGPVWRGGEERTRIEGSRESDAVYFAADKAYAEEYGDAKPYFLKAHRPFSLTSETDAKAILSAANKLAEDAEVAFTNKTGPYPDWQWDVAGDLQDAYDRAKRSKYIQTGGAMVRALTDVGQKYGSEKVGEVIRAAGFDSLYDTENEMWKGTPVYGVYQAKQIKSADPLALDDNGNLITPDQWADPDTSDIRFEKKSTMSPEQKKANDAMHAVASRLGLDEDTHKTVHDMAYNVIGKKRGIAEDDFAITMLSAPEMMEVARAIKQINKKKVDAMAYFEYGRSMEELTDEQKNNIYDMMKLSARPSKVRETLEQVSPEEMKEFRDISDSRKDVSRTEPKASVRSGVAQRIENRAFQAVNALKPKNIAQSTLVRLNSTLFSQFHTLVDKIFGPEENKLTTFLKTTYNDMARAHGFAIQESGEWLMNKRRELGYKVFKGERKVNVAGKQMRLGNAVGIAMTTIMGTDAERMNILWQSNFSKMSQEDFSNLVKDAVARTKEDEQAMKFITLVNDYFAWIFPILDKAYGDHTEATTGERKSLGNIKKGYWPMMREFGLFIEQDEFFEKLESILPAAERIKKSETPAMVKSRSWKEGMPIRMDAEMVFNQYLRQADIFRSKSPYLRQLSEVLNDSEIRKNANIKTGSNEYIQALWTHVDRVRYISGQNEVNTPLDRALLGVYNNMITSSLFFNVISQMRQVLSLPEGIGNVPGGPGPLGFIKPSILAAKYWYDMVHVVPELLELSKSKTNYADVDKIMLAIMKVPSFARMMKNSPQIAVSKYNPATAEHISEMEQKNLMSQFRVKGIPLNQLGMLPFTWFDLTTKCVVWNVAYESRMTELERQGGKTQEEMHKDAVAYAEEDVRKTQPASTQEERNLWQSGSVGMRFLTPFTGVIMKRYDYFRHDVYGALKTAYETEPGGPADKLNAVCREFFVGDSAKGRASVARKAFHSYMVPMIGMGMLAMGRPPQSWEELLGWFFAYNVSMYPMVGPIAGYLYLKETAQEGMSPLYVELANAFGKFLAGKGGGDLTYAMTKVTGIPATGVRGFRTAAKSLEESGDFDVQEIEEFFKGFLGVQDWPIEYKKD